MSELRANTDIMRNGASTIAKAAGDLGGIVSRVNGLANQIGGEYQGQLRDKVRPILSSLGGQGSQVESRSGELGVQLSAKATDIDAVMEFGDLSAATALTPSIMSPMARFFNGVNQLALGVAAAVLGWLGLSRTQVTYFAGDPTSTQPTPTEEASELVPPTGRSLSASPYYKYGDKYVDGAHQGIPHPGVDIDGNEGDNIHPIGAGKVVKIGNEPGGYGNYIVVEHKLTNGETVYSVYAHLQEAPSVKEGTRVTTDSVIGHMGHSGKGSGGVTHLHLEVRTSDGYTTWRNYTDLANPNWKKYWINPEDVIGNPAYEVQSPT